MRNVTQPRGRQQLWAFMGVVLAAQLCAWAARADITPEPAGYREAVDDAVREFGLHHFEESRSLFSRAHALFPNARTFRGIGIAEFELRNYAECTRQLKAALQSPVRPLDGALRADTEQLLARAQRFVARYTIEAKPGLDRLVVDGSAAALSADHQLVLQVGDHLLELYRAGFVPEKRRLRVAGGEVTTLTVIFSQPERADGGSDRIIQSPWLWAAVSAAVAAGLTAGIAAAVSSGSGHAAAVNGGTSGVVIPGP